MSTVVERLVESWLDSQTERRYQAAFVQMLVSQGWSVLHSTRHSALEFGKDVVARAPDGDLYAFQLKGNPGSRLTKSEAQGLVPQIEELTKVPLPLNFRKGSERFRAVLVTNGEIDEEASTLLALMAGDLTAQTAAISLSWWGRGELVSRLLLTAGQVWPTSPEGTRTLLNLLAADGSDLPDIHALTQVLLETAPEPDRKPSASLLNSRLSATLLIAEIAKSKWYEANNHFALYQMTIIAAMFASKFIAKGKSRKNLVQNYASVALTHARDLLAEAQRDHFDPDEIWIVGDPLADVDVMWHRRNLIAECASVLLLAKEPEAHPTDVGFARKLIESSLEEPKIWGEGAIPSLILRYWALYPWGGIRGEHRLAAILSRVLAANRSQSPGTFPLAAPYYDFTSCWARSAGVPWMADAGIFQESFEDRIWTARVLLLMLAKRNLKVTCKALWPAFSQLLHECVEIDPRFFRQCVLADEGRQVSRTYYGRTWNQLLEEATTLEQSCDYLADFDDMPWLVAAYVAAVPYRAWEPVVMWLDRKLCRTWH